MSFLSLLSFINHQESKYFYEFFFLKTVLKIKCKTKEFRNAFKRDKFWSFANFKHLIKWDNKSVVKSKREVYKSIRLIKLKYFVNDKFPDQLGNWI